MRPLSALLLSCLLVACGSKDDPDEDDDDGGVEDTGLASDGGVADGGAADGGAADGGSSDGGAPGDGGGSDGGAPGDGGGSDGGGSDGGGGDGGGSSGSPCPDYSGLGAVGAWREYSTTAAYESSTGVVGGYRLEVEEVSAGGRVVVSMDSDYTYSDGGRAVGTARYTYDCDASGSYLTLYEADGSYSSATYSYTWWQDTTYTDPYLSLVPGIGTGTSWSDSWAWTYDYWSSVGGSYSDTASGSTSYSAGAESTVTVPAGSFTVRRFDTTTTTSGHSSSTSWYGDAELGTVKSDYYELVGYGG